MWDESTYPALMKSGNREVVSPTLFNGRNYDSSFANLQQNVNVTKCLLFTLYK